MSMGKFSMMLMLKLSFLTSATFTGLSSSSPFQINVESKIKLRLTTLLIQNSNLKDDKMPAKGCLNPEGRILQLKRIAILNVDWGVVHENPKGWFHH